MQVNATTTGSKARPIETYHEPQTAGGPARPRRFYTVADVAAELGLSEPTVYRAIRAGQFPAIRVRGRYVVPAKAIDAMEEWAVATGLVDAADVMLQRAGERRWS